MDTLKNKKIRSANYIVQEKELLISLAAKYKDIIENKKTDGLSVSDKNEIWRKIEAEFNLVAPNLCFRSAESLRKCYENQKKELRKKVAEQKKQLYLTGGGPFAKSKTDDSDELLLDIINDKTVFGLENPFDSDCHIRKVQPEPQTSGLSTTLSNCENFDLQMESSTSTHLKKMPNDNVSEYHVINIQEESCDSICETPSKSNWSHFKADDLKRPNNLKRSIGELIDDSTRNNVEIVYDANTVDTDNICIEKRQPPSVSDGNAEKKESRNFKRSYKSKGTRENGHTSRRRPHSTIQLMSGSTLYTKYEQLVDKKIVNEDFLRQESQLRMVYLQRKHELQIKSLELDVEIKKRQLEALNKNFTPRIDHNM